MVLVILLSSVVDKKYGLNENMAVLIERSWNVSSDQDICNKCRHRLDFLEMEELRLWTLSLLFLVGWWD